MYIDRIKIASLRCFNRSEFGLRHGEQNEGLRAPNVNLLLGDNGAGKTTVLRALALTALAPVMAKSSGYVPRNMIRTGAKQATVEVDALLHEQDVGHPVKAPQKRTLGIAIRQTGDHEYLEEDNSRKKGAAAGPVFFKMFDDKSPSFLVVGYGATRRVEDAASFSTNEQLKRRVLRYQRVAGLFESHLALRPLVPWLPDLMNENKGRYTQVVNLIDNLLPEDAVFTGKREPGDYGEYLFRIHGMEAPFSALSDGYRAYIGWIADLLYHVCMGAPSGAKLTENRGLVLVDEIDLHLHPEWQRVVVSNLAKALPNLQFVFSTHSPIVAGSLERENIFVMETGDNGASRVAQYKERIYGMDAQQVLLSPYFGLTSTRAPGFVDEIHEMSKTLTPDRPDVALAMMRKLAGAEIRKPAAPPVKAAPKPVKAASTPVKAAPTPVKATAKGKRRVK